MRIYKQLQSLFLEFSAALARRRALGDAYRNSVMQPVLSQKPK
ncbi:hypothetical protein [Mesorhizobium caraganae]|nr:hypothetical protein [Mesorhizobium caraganae]